MLTYRRSKFGRGVALNRQPTIARSIRYQRSVRLKIACDHWSRVLGTSIIDKQLGTTGSFHKQPVEDNAHVSPDTHLP